MSKRIVNAISGVILGVTLISAIVILSINDADKNSATVVTLIGIVSMLVMQSITNSKSADASDKVRKVDDNLTNGLIPDKVREAIASDEGKRAIREAITEDTEPGK